MGFGFGAKVGEGWVGEKVGSAGSQEPMMALWLAAYAVDGRPESKRVCAWVNSYRGWGKTHPDAPVARRNQPRTVERLIAFTFDTNDDPAGEPECTALIPQDDTIRLGLKFVPARDPVLADLVDLYLRTNDDADYQGVLPPDLVARLADIFESLLPRLRTAGYWYLKMERITAVFRAAADGGAGVHYG